MCKPEPAASARLVVGAIAVGLVLTALVAAGMWVWAELPWLVLLSFGVFAVLGAWCSWMAVHYRRTPPWERLPEPVPERIALEAHQALAIGQADPVTAVILASDHERIPR